jgi:hypothetical protein
VRLQIAEAKTYRFFAGLAWAEDKRANLYQVAGVFKLDNFIRNVGGYRQHACASLLRTYTYLHHAIEDVSHQFWLQRDRLRERSPLIVINAHQWAVEPKVCGHDV